MTDTRFQVLDLVQLQHEYEVQGNPSLFRILKITRTTAILGQLNPDGYGYIGVNIEVELDDPDLIEPHPEILHMYSHVR